MRKKKKKRKERTLRRLPLELWGHDLNGDHTLFTLLTPLGGNQWAAIADWDVDCQVRVGMDFEKVIARIERSNRESASDLIDTIEDYSLQMEAHDMSIVWQVNPPKKAIDWRREGF
jgi:hypothetical protein